MPKFWMVRAGEGSSRAADFERQETVAIGWKEAGDLTGIDSLDAMRQRIAESSPAASKGTRANYAGQLNKFRSAMQPGDRVVTYDGDTREYLLGTIVGNYEYRPDALDGFAHLRRVKWDGRISKDVVAERSANTLGAILTIFDPGPEALTDLEDALKTNRTAAPGSSAIPEDANTVDFDSIFVEFRDEYLNTEQSAAHREANEQGAASGRANFREIEGEKAAGRNTTDLVLRKLLPHTPTKAHRANGDWVHVAPAITGDIRSWYEGSGWAKPDEWPAKAAHVLWFVERAVAEPSQIQATCTTFAASPLAKGFQSGMLSPILNALDSASFRVVNSKVTKTLAALTGTRHRVAIVDFPATNLAIQEFIESHPAIRESAVAKHMDASTVFDMFAHWFVAVREDDEGDEAEEETGPTIARGALDRSSPRHAQIVLERLCPDGAPRTTATAYLAHIIRDIHHLAPSAWSVTLKRKLVRVNVGGIVACDLRPDGFFLTVYEASIDPSSRVIVDKYDQDVDWRYIDGANGYLIPYSALDPALGLLRPAHDELIRRALAKSEKAPFRGAHSPGVLVYLREVGLDVPDPDYARAPNAPTVIRVTESATPPYRIPVAYTIDECVAETSLSFQQLTSWVKALGRKGQAILYGPPGTGKTFVAQRLARHLTGGSDGIVDLVQFHPAYAYEDFMQGLRPIVGGGAALQYAMVPGRFIDFCSRAEKRSGVCVLIVDEINRANLAEVFGELMYLLEYRDQEMPLAGGGRFRIPPNVRIIGTMNTADRSIALVDHALRRRFAFLRLEPQFEVLERFHARHGSDVAGLISVLRRVNDAIGDPNYSLGISFFMRESLREDLEAVWTFEVEPYLDEYFFDNTKTVDAYRWAGVKEEIEL